MKALLKTVFITILLLTCVSIYAITENDLVFLRIQPSSIGRAMGWGNNSVADIWHQDPLVIWDNPALSSMHDGIAYGYTDDAWLDELDYLHYNFSSAMLSVGYYGFGLALPVNNAKDQSGTTFDFGTRLHYAPNSSFEATHAYENARYYNISFNPIKFMHTIQPDNNEMSRNLNLAFGVSYIKVDSDIGSTAGEFGRPDKANIYDAGLAASYKKSVVDLINCEASIGLKVFNITKEYLKNHADGISDQIGRSDVLGFGLSASIPVNKVPAAKIIPSYLSEDLVTVRLLGSGNKTDDPDIKLSLGTEIGVLETFMLRGGYYYDHDGEVKGFTYGAGLNFHYSTLLAMEANYARFTGGELQDYQSSWDFMTKIDLVNLVNLFF